MDRTLQRCLVGSTVAHGGVLLFVLLVGTLAARKVLEPDVPVLQIIPADIRLTQGDQIGGGTPNPLPLASREIAGPPPVAPPQVTPAPAPAPAAAPAPKPRAEPKPVDPKPVDPVPKAAPPSPTVKPSAPKIELAKEPRLVAKAQDVDSRKLADKPVKMASAAPSAVEVSGSRRRRTDDDKKASEKAAAEAAEAAASAARAREERISATRTLADRLFGAATGVSKNAGATTQIQMPGPGGAAYAPYYSYLQAFLKQQWRKPPTSSEKEAAATVELTLARDGTVLSAEITRRSGVAALDASVEELFRRHRKLRPLPDEYDGTRLVVPVKFVLESSASP